MKLEVGMYVRTKYGITQYKEYNTTNGKLLCMPVKDGTNGIFANLEDIIGEPSFNPIDLIEVGDYVNGLLIVDKFYDYANKEMVFQTDRCNFRDLEDIKSIVTKEQFESMSYKVGK